MTAPDSHNRTSRRERIARAAVGMPAGHPELVTRKPGRVEWKHLARWLAEYTAIMTEARRQDGPPEIQGWR